MNIFSKLFEKFKDALFPRDIKCICCKEELNNNSYNSICENCLKSLVFLTSNFCERCGAGLPPGITGSCIDCKRGRTFKQARSVFVYNDTLKPCIYRYKYERYSHYARPLAKFLSEKFSTLDWNIDVVSAVPLYKTRLKLRGYNQTDLLCKEFCALQHLPYQDLAIRTRDTPSQTKLSKQERKANMAEAFKVISRKDVKGKNILIIDDLFTTGATSDELSKTYLKAGANAVFVLAVAHADIPNNF